MPGLLSIRSKRKNWRTGVNFLDDLSFGYGFFVTDPISLNSLNVKVHYKRRCPGHNDVSIFSRVKMATLDSVVPS